MPNLVEAIRAWPAASEGCDFAALVSYLTGCLNTPLSEPEVQNAVNWLTARGLANLHGDRLKLTEPDRPELRLYEPLSKQINNRGFLRTLGIKPGTYVFQDTSNGGATGFGPLSRPDFTFATIRATRFEKALEITTIEVKNRAGANVNAVYDIRAHRRVSHFPYLACPRSHLNPASTELIGSRCRDEDIGLILFDIELDGDGGCEINRLKIEHKPGRAAPDPELADQYLASRFSPENCAALETIRGA